MNLAISPQDAWQPLPAGEWNATQARHLLRRAGWTARPADVARAVAEGLPATLDRFFPAESTFLPKPKLIGALEESAPDYVVKIRDAAPEEKRLLQKEMRERSQRALQDLSLKWLRQAARPDGAAFAKWVLFLGDVYVISSEKIQNTALVWQHYDILARHALGPAPTLSKAVSRSPAMVQYLDLNQSQRNAPNENFARELFELFVLGEGNYTEMDIKEAARAFTGYRARPLRGGEFFYAANQHDGGDKTVFGETGKFTGDQVIDLAYRQKAASAFLPREMVKFYLSDKPLPPAYLDALGERWRAGGHDLAVLVRAFFGGRIFYQPEFHGGFIKSPVQFYLGLLQDFGLDVAPLPRALNPLRQMGQMLFNPPNVRGWVGGRQWINSATLAARRQLVEALFTPLNEDNLNADERMEIVAARADGAGRFTVGDAGILEEIAGTGPDEAADRLVRELLAASSAPTARASVRQFLAAGPADPGQRLRRVRRATVALLQSPEYQLC